MITFSVGGASPSPPESALMSPSPLSPSEIRGRVQSYLSTAVCKLNNICGTRPGYRNICYKWPDDTKIIEDNLIFIVCNNIWSLYRIITSHQQLEVRSGTTQRHHSA